MSWNKNILKNEQKEKKCWKVWEQRKKHKLKLLHGECEREWWTS